MGLLGTTAEEPRSKLFRYIISVAVFVALVSLGIWYLVRFRAEKRAVGEFLNTLEAGQFEQAYTLWKPQPSYSYKDFLEDWGPDGYYGPVKSYRIEHAEELKDASGIVITVEVSAYSPFPGKEDVIQQSKTKEVRLWVEKKDHSLSFAP